MGTHTETRAVLAAAYPRVGEGWRTSLTHAAEVNDGKVVRILCGRVALTSIADVHATDPGAAPTCKRCVSLLRKGNAA